MVPCHYLLSSLGSPHGPCRRQLAGSGDRLGAEGAGSGHSAELLRGLWDWCWAKNSAETPYAPRAEGWESGVGGWSEGTYQPPSQQTAASPSTPSIAASWLRPYCIIHQGQGSCTGAGAVVRGDRLPGQP